MHRAHIDVPLRTIAEFCKRNRIRKLALFGSVLRDDFRPDSDVDVLVEFEPGHVPGLVFFRLQEELTAIFNRQVDLNTPQFIPAHARDSVLKHAHVQYESA